MDVDLDELEREFLARYDAEEAFLQRLFDAVGTSSGEKKNIDQLDRIADKGLEFCIRRLKDDSRIKRLTLATEFVKFGSKAVLLTGSQRGGDFLNNQLRGQWAEQVVVSMDVDGLVFVPFGPSAAAMPGEQDHRETIMTFRAITLLEGKRPDLLAFDTERWGDLSRAERHAALEWPSRLLVDSDLDLVGEAKAGIEVKNSTWHYGKRREFGGAALSITVKEEELEAIAEWERESGVPVVFFQVLFDELYAMSFARMEGAIARGYLYEAEDLVSGSEQGAGGKVWHRFHLDDFTHRCGTVRFPDESEAVIRVLENGSVVPYIAYKPAEARCTDADVIWREIEFD